ncbi:hypothetical protein U6B65_05355 [Oscillospiraceae bacterium MB08-C2-2]|nr:hypothetical protein U6B65_05355 [Oscillospiraceae bacterium MB08-C2-2]
MANNTLRSTGRPADLSSPSDILRQIPVALLLAVVYTSFMVFIQLLLPYSGEHREKIAALLPSLREYGFMMAGAFICSTAAVIGASEGEGRGPKLFLPLLLACFGAWCVIPNFSGLLLQGTPGTASFNDTLVSVAGGMVVSALLLLLAFLCIPKLDSNGEKARVKSGYQLNVVGLLLKILLLTVVYVVLYFVSWYFLQWRFEAARVFFSGVAENQGMDTELVNVLLTNIRLIPVLLLKGLAYALIAVVPLRSFLDKRLSYMVLVALLFLSDAAMLLGPSPLIPADVRMAMALDRGVSLLLFGLLTGFLLHGCYIPNPAAEVTRTAAVRSGAAGARPAAARPRQPADPTRPVAR